MSKPYIHAQSSARKFGGEPQEYLKFHEWFDQTKSHFPDQRHRAILHSSFGIYLCAQVFGDTFTNSAGKVVSVRDIGEQHVLEDFGNKFIPTIQDYLGKMPLDDWMQNGKGHPPSHIQIAEQIKEKKTLKVDAMLFAAAQALRPHQSGTAASAPAKPEVFFDGAKPVPFPGHLKD